MEEEKAYIRSDFKFNTLAKEIFRVDFYALDNFDEILEKLEKYFRGHNFSYNQFNNYNINFELNDPEPLITESFMLKKNVEVIQNYEFSNEDDSCKFILNQNMLIFDKGNFNSYEGIEKYFDLFEGALSIINSISDVKPSRLGIRKINELLVSDKESLIKFFNEMYLYDFSRTDDNEKGLVFEYSYRPFYENDISINKNIKIAKGKLRKKDEITTAFSFIWDLDCYKRFDDSGNFIQEFRDLCIEINNKIFDEYCDIISEELYVVLKGAGSLDGIYGGINNGES